MPSFRTKGKGANRKVFPVDRFTRRVHGKTYRHKKVYPNNKPKDNRSLSDRMIDGEKDSKWRTMRAFKTKDEAVTHKAELEAQPNRSDQSFKIVKGNDPTYQYEVQYSKKDK